jgi:hypothetical protein
MLINGAILERLLEGGNRAKKGKEISLKDRLIITPILDCDNKFSKGSASFDVRLGTCF